MLQDYAVLAWQAPAVQAVYTPRLCAAAMSGGTAPLGDNAAVAGDDGSSAAPIAVLASNAAALRRAWGAALGAASCALAQQLETAGQGGADFVAAAAAAGQQAALLDLCQLALCLAAGAEPPSSDGGGGGGSPVLGPLLAALEALRRLTAPPFRTPPPPLGCELVSLLRRLLQLKLLPALWPGQATAPPPQLPAVAEAAAGVLQQLAAEADGTDVLAVAEGCLTLAAAAPGSTASEHAMAAALAAVSVQIHAAASASTAHGFVPDLHRALLLGLRLASTPTEAPGSNAAAAAGATLLSDVCAAASAGDEAARSAAAPLLAAAAASLCQQAKSGVEGAAAAHSWGEEDSSCATAERVGLLLDCVLAVGSNLSSDWAAPAVAAGAVSEADWSDDPFTEAGGEAGAPVAGRPVPQQVPPASGVPEPASTDAQKQQLQQQQAGPVEEALALCLETLEQAALSSSLGVQRRAATALRAQLQQRVASGGGGVLAQQHAWQWALECAGAGLPGLAARAHGLMQGCGPLAAPEAALVLEVLRAGLLAVTVAAAQPAEEAAAAALLRVMVPLAVEASAPVPGPPTPGVADTAIALLSHLAAGPAGPAFRAVVAELPADTKQRLASALQPWPQRGEVAPGAAAQPAAAQPAGGRPGIQLKMFAPPPPPARSL